MACCVSVPPATEDPAAVAEPGRFGAYQWRLLLFVCFGWMIDGMEMYVMSLLLPELPAEWELSALGRGMLGGSVFIGMAFGAVGFGVLSDRVGRLPVVRVTIALALVFGLLCAAAQSMVALLLLRGSFGVAVGGLLPALITLLAESMPPGAVGTSVGLTQNMFAVGGMFVSAIAAIVLGPLGWRWLLFFSGLPLLLCFPFFIPGFLFESSMWLVATGRHESADGVARSIAVVNGEPPPAPLGVRAADPPRSFAQQLRHLFVSHATLTLPLLPLWGLVSWGYYGIVFVLPTYLNRHIPHESEYIGVPAAQALASPRPPPLPSPTPELPPPPTRPWSAASPRTVQVCSSPRSPRYRATPSAAWRPIDWGGGERWGARTPQAARWPWPRAPSPFSPSKQPQAGSGCCWARVCSRRASRPPLLSR